MYRIYVLFMLSGAAGLIYQVVWSRMLHEVFGVTVYAVTTVLATFLAGLGLGGWLLGRQADRRADPLRCWPFASSSEPWSSCHPRFSWVEPCPRSPARQSDGSSAWAAN